MTAKTHIALAALLVAHFVAAAPAVGPDQVDLTWMSISNVYYELGPLKIDTLFAEFRQRGASFVKELSFIDDGLWGFEVTDGDGYVLAFFRTRSA